MKTYQKILMSILLVAGVIFVSTSNASATITADIVFVFDESQSMSPDQQEVKNNIGIFSQAMADAGIDVRYGLIGFGWSATPGGSPYIRLVSDLTDEAGLVAALDTLHAQGRYEHGFEATRFALDNISYRDGSIINIILITDEDSDGVEGGADATLYAMDALWNGIVNMEDYEGPAGSYQTLASNHSGQLFNILDFRADPDGFIAYFADVKVQEIIDHNGDNGVIPEPTSMLLFGVGLLSSFGIKRKIR